MGRSPCCDKSKVKRGSWSPEEDATLKNYLLKHGTPVNWITLPHQAGLKRCGKSCRLRWMNYLRPDIKHGAFSQDEVNTICSLYCTIGSKWSTIASHLPGRTDNDIKNYWHSKLKKKLMMTSNINTAKTADPTASNITVAAASTATVADKTTTFLAPTDSPNYFPVPSLFTPSPNAYSTSFSFYHEHEHMNFEYPRFNSCSTVINNTGIPFSPSFQDSGLNFGQPLFGMDEKYGVQTFEASSGIWSQLEPFGADNVPDLFSILQGNTQKGKVTQSQ